MNKKLIIALICLNVIAVLCWGGVQIFNYSKKQQKLAENKKSALNDYVVTGILNKEEGERLIDISQYAGAGNQITDADLDWTISLYRKKWDGMEVKDELVCWDVLSLYQSMRNMSTYQRKKISDYGLSLYSTGGQELNSTRKGQVIRFGLVTKDERFVPIIVQFSHDENKKVRSGANATLKYLGVSAGEPTALSK